MSIYNPYKTKINGRDQDELHDETKMNIYKTKMDTRDLDEEMRPR